MHTKVKEGNEEEETTRGASLRELQRFFKEHDKDEGYAGLRRIADKDGTAVWTILKETEVAAAREEAAEARAEAMRAKAVTEAEAQAMMAAKAKVKAVEARAEVEAAAA